jgi:hypothetical protein
MSTFGERITEELKKAREWEARATPDGKKDAHELVKSLESRCPHVHKIYDEKWGRWWCTDGGHWAT